VAGGPLVFDPRAIVAAFSGSENPRVITRTVPSTSARDQSDLWRGLTFAIDRLDPIGIQSKVVPLPKWAHCPCETAGQKADKPGLFAAAASPLPGLVGWSCAAVRGSPRERASVSIPTGDRVSFRVQWAGAPCPLASASRQVPVCIPTRDRGNECIHRTEVVQSRLACRHREDQVKHGAQPMLGGQSAATYSTKLNAFPHESPDRQLCNWSV